MNYNIRFPLNLLTLRLPLFMLAVLIATVWGLAGCSASAANPKPVPATPEVTVAEVLHRPLRDWSEFTGRLEAVQTVEIRPRVAGYIERVAFQEGARVKKGQLLFQIDPRPFRAEVERLTAARTRAASE